MKKLIAIGLTLFASGTALGAASMYAVRHKVAVGITSAQASTCASTFTSWGAWDQTTAEMDQCRCARTDSALYPTGFVAECVGTKKKNADSLEAGDQVDTVIP